MSMEKSLNPRDDRKNTIRDMKILGVYKSEYDPLIDVYSDLLSQYYRANKEFEGGDRAIRTNLK